MFVHLELDANDYVSMTMNILGYLKSYIFDNSLPSILPIKIRCNWS